MPARMQPAHSSASSRAASAGPPPAAAAGPEWSRRAARRRRRRRCQSGPASRHQRPASRRHAHAPLCAAHGCASSARRAQPPTVGRHADGAGRLVAQQPRQPGGARQLPPQARLAGDFHLWRRGRAGGRGRVCVVSLAALCAAAAAARRRDGGRLQLQLQPLALAPLMASENDIAALASSWCAWWGGAARCGPRAGRCRRGAAVAARCAMRLGACSNVRRGSRRSWRGSLPLDCRGIERGRSVGAAVAPRGRAGLMGRAECGAAARAGRLPQNPGRRRRIDDAELPARTIKTTRAGLRWPSWKVQPTFQCSKHGAPAGPRRPARSELRRQPGGPPSRAPSPRRLPRSRSRRRPRPSPLPTAARARGRCAPPAIGWRGHGAAGPLRPGPPGTRQLGGARIPPMPRRRSRGGGR
jgi:hypothetical protein